MGKQRAPQSSVGWIAAVLGLAAFTATGYVGFDANEDQQLKFMLAVGVLWCVYVVQFISWVRARRNSTPSLR